MRRASALAPRALGHLRALLGLVPCALLAPGCAYPRIDEPPSVTHAWDRPLETALGTAMAPAVEAHPGRTGIYLLGSGLDAFVARVLLIEQAERALDVQYYILHDDETARFLLARLLAAADRDVRVRLLVDDLGTKELDETLAALDAHPALEVRIFNPFARGPLPGLARTLDLLGRPRTLNRRMHNKMLAADGAAAIVGGRNLGD
jgi:putative cardiolipin synthase